MGNRISISFKNGDSKSVALFSHWRGESLLDDVHKYLLELDKILPSGISEPLDRREPRTVMVDFIRWLTKDMAQVTHDLYLGVDGSDGDNSDNGHFAIDLNKKVTKNVVKRVK